MFIDALDVDDVLAHLLVTEGFTSVEDVAYVPIEDLLSIEGFDEEIANELRARAQNFLTEQEKKMTEKRKELGVSDDVASIPGLTPAMLVTLGEAGIKTRDDLAEYAGYELSDPADGILKSHGISEEDANAIITAARAHWFEGEEKAEATPAASAE